MIRDGLSVSGTAQIPGTAVPLATREEPDSSNTVILSGKKAKKQDTECFENRELSWLKFNERVMEEAEDSTNPLGERLSFLSIYQTNLDEFFMVRVGSLHDQMILDPSVRDNKTFMTSREQISAISKRVRRLSPRNAEAFRDCMAGLRNYGIRLTNFASLEKSEAAYLEAFFKAEVLPLLSPVVVTKKQPFPFLENEDLYAFCMLGKKGERDRIGMVACSVRSLNRLIPIRTHKGEYMLAEELILHFLPLVFRSYTVGEKAVVRITRNADIDADNIYDEDLDYRELMQKLIRSRKRLAPVRLEYTRSMNKKTISRLCNELDLPEEQAFLTERPLDLSFLGTFRNTLYSTNPELFYERRQPQRPVSLDENRPVIDQVLEHDVLLYYPYERMNPTITLLQEAARDPDVVSIRMTLYRLAKNSQIVSALVAASEAGKQVDVLVELKARFDEENNIHWSHMLEDAGCHVMYGLGPYKVHSKLLLVTRVRDGKTEFITQIGTGNYNENTARLYTDLCFMTAKENIGLDAVRVFQALSLEELPTEFEKLLVSPLGLQNRIIEMIDFEIEEKKAGRPAYIGLKLNSITDKDIIDKLIEASAAGVKIDMIVRGISCLHSAIPEKTDNIHLISIVGRFLEHARIYIFGTPERERVYIASADFMTRNTLRRVEVAAPVEEPELREKIHRIFSLQLQDNVKAREQCPDGIYRKRVPAADEPEVNSQELFYERAYSEDGL
ncbi:MAG: polyphosphate kinase 1 [Lachnospiraceae bacterium]|nr:polyphosphate kinase 1 [Lachnospiraceae bacterium]